MSTRTPKANQSNITVVHGMEDYSKAPRVLEKLEKAKTFIAKNGLPKDQRQKKNK